MFYYFAIGIAISIWVTFGMVKLQKGVIRKQKDSEKETYAKIAIGVSLFFFVLCLFLWPLFIIARVLGKSIGKEVV